MNNEIIILTENKANETYVSDCGHTMKRDKGDEHPLFKDKWVLRDSKGKYIDHDKYRNDLAQRNNMKIKRDRTLYFEEAKEEEIA